ncbi:MAG: ATP-binding protein [Saprospiraceae bacterium]
MKKTSDKLIIPKQEEHNIIKIVLFGPESTGKTTLSNQLARHYNTVWAPEYARNYLQDKWNNYRKTCENSDIMPIAIGQMKLENKLAQKADKLLICDTDLLETKIYSQEYYGGFVDPKLDHAAKKNKYDLYLLTYIDTPWEADDLRDKPDQRLEMFKAFEQALVDHKCNYIILKGNKNKRLKASIKAIDALMENKENLFTFSDDLEDVDMHLMASNERLDIF